MSWILYCLEQNVYSSKRRQHCVHYCMKSIGEWSNDKLYLALIHRTRKIYPAKIANNCLTAWSFTPLYEYSVTRSFFTTENCARKVQSPKEDNLDKKNITRFYILYANSSFWLIKCWKFNKKVKIKFIRRMVRKWVRRRWD